MNYMWDKPSKEQKAPETMTATKAGLWGFAVGLCTVAVLYLIMGAGYWFDITGSNLAFIALPFIMGIVGAVVGAVAGLFLKRFDPLGTPR